MHSSLAEPTIALRIVRAERTLAEAHIPFEVPRGAELAARLSSVPEVIYLIFNEGYTATAGDDWTRPELCEDALRLGRILAELLPTEADSADSGRGFASGSVVFSRKFPQPIWIFGHENRETAHGNHWRAHVALVV